MLFISTITVTSAPRDGFNLGGGFSLSPFVEGSATYDSNVYLSENNEKDDIYLGLVGGLSLLKKEEAFTMNLRGWYRARRYMEYDAEDDDIFQENFDLVLGNIENLQFKFDQRYSEVSDYEFIQAESSSDGSQEDLTLRLIEGRTRRTKRDLIDLGASLARQTDKLTTRVGIGYASVDFDNNSFNKWEETEGAATIAYEVTDKSSLALAGSYGQHETKNRIKNSEYVKLRAGMKSHRTDKVTFNIGGGAQFYRAEDSTGNSTDLDKDIFHYDASAAWAVSRKISLQLFGRNEIIPTSAYDENTKEVSQGSVGGLWRPFEDWQTTLGGSYRQDDYSRPINGVDAKETLKGIQWRVGYLPVDQVANVALKIRYERFESNIQHDYDQLRASIVLNVAY
ncbi:outer membrane beta-barrel protein [PVC group bacterium]|nr:outer membrane beta-barrel protein [PVC group bacterium]